MEDLAKYQTVSMKDVDRDLKEFVATLNQKPSEKDIKINGMANGAKYLPIEKVEEKLNYYFNGLWETRNFKYQVVVNEIVGDIELRVFHPVAGIWLTRSGAGAVMIQQTKGSNITDIGSKIKNTLVKDMGHLKAECIKNAAKSLGVAFGSNLNRDLEDGLGNVDEIEVILQDLEDCTELKQLTGLFNRLPEVAKNDKRIKRAFTNKKIQLS